MGKLLLFKPKPPPEPEPPSEIDELAHSIRAMFSDEEVAEIKRNLEEEVDESDN